jgi:nucleoside phosphorylase
MLSNHTDIGILTVISAELDAAFHALQIARLRDRKKNSDGTNYWNKIIYSNINNRDFNIVLTCIGSAGNYDAAAATTALIKEFHPRFVILVGIAAGVREKIKIGEVVLSERIVAYESGVLENNKDVEFIPRPDMNRIDHAVEQDVVAYLSNQRNLDELFRTIGGIFPQPTSKNTRKYEKYVTTTINVKSATVASGEKLLRNPDKLKYLREAQHGKIEVGEMEAAGFSSACRRSGCSWLVIRGISDFGDELKSDDFHRFASKAATTVLADFIRNGLDLDYNSSGSYSSTSRQIEKNFPHLPGLSIQIAHLIHPASSAPEFDLRISLGNNYEDITSENFIHESITPKQLLEYQNYRRVLIHAPGGYGKTTVMCMIAKEAIDKGQVVFFLDLKTGSGKKISPESIDIKNIFDTFSVEGSSENFLQALKLEVPILLLVDGLNEVYSNASDAIMKLLERVTREHITLQVIVADRMNPHEGIRFFRATIDALTEIEISRYLPPTVKVPSENNHLQLLSIPFFLDLQLRLWSDITRQKSVLSRKEMFRRYLKEVAEVSPCEQSALAKSAYDAYEKHTSRTFRNDWWVESISSDLAMRLEAAGVIVESRSPEHERSSCMFRHQLLHDFLVGEYLASLSEEKWDSVIFDVATFQTNSIESLSFAAELLGEKAEEFLIKVYDWSYRSVNYCIADLKRSLVRSPISGDLEFALTAKNAEKLFDRFEDTSEGARRRLNQASSALAKDFLESKTLSDVLQLVNQYKPTSERFKEWKRLFLMLHDSQVREQDLLLLDNDPIIGWTAANSFRRVNLTKVNIGQIRILYRSAVSDRKNVVRWRIVHLLGAFPLLENVELLFEAALSDNYEWARYGAVRSLMEIASLSDKEQRQHIICKLILNLERLDLPLILQEIRRTCLIYEVDCDWYLAIHELVSKASQMSAAEPESEVWRELLEKIVRRGANAAN